MDLTSAPPLTLTSEEGEGQTETNNLISSSNIPDVNPPPLPSMPIIVSPSPSSTTPATELNTNQEDEVEDDLCDPEGPKLVMAVWE